MTEDCYIVADSFAKELVRRSDILIRRSWRPYNGCSGVTATGFLFPSDSARKSRTNIDDVCRGVENVGVRSLHYGFGPSFSYCAQPVIKDFGHGGGDGLPS
jgi:hypothetical protein